ncbi:hypothetical protein EDD15DRAFT_2201304 [Pisolithus albus]|nr:hypothetical protein EDD15DRAFT_2201304 [Pisolithus albus]
MPACLLGQLNYPLFAGFVSAYSIILVVFFITSQDLINIAFEDKSNWLSKDATTQSVAEHGVACLLIFEFCYFLLLNEQPPIKEDVALLAIKEYKSSGVEATIHQAVEVAVHQHGHDVKELCKILLQVVLENSHKLLA